MQVVAAGIVGRYRLGAFPPSQVGTGQVSRAAQQLRQHLTKGIQAELRGLAGCDFLAFVLTLIDKRFGLTGKIGRQFATNATFEFGSQLRVRPGVGLKLFVPGLFGGRATVAGAPLRVDIVGDFKAAVVPAQRFARQGDFLVAQWRAVTLFFTGFIGRPHADHGLAADQRRLARLGARRLDGRSNGIAVVAINRRNHLPAVGLETFRGVVAEPAFHFAIDGNAVVIVESNQLAQTQGSRQRADFVGDAFHHATVAEEGVGVVIDHVVAVAVKLGRQDFFGRCHAHGVGNALPQWASGGFYTGCIAVFGVAGSFAVQLTEVLQIVDRQLITAEVQQRVNQHGAVTIRQHKAVAVGPVRVGRIVLEIVPPQHFCNVRHSHWRTGVTGVGFLDGVHAQGTDSVGKVAARGHRELLILWWRQRGRYFPLPRAIQQTSGM